MITETQLKAILNRASDADIKKYLPWLNTFFVRYDIATPHRKAAFLAQAGHESNHLKCVEENLNYSAAGLRSTFEKYFPTDEAADEAARKPKKIANIVYVNRMGNGNMDSGDGWRFRGRGLLQITGRANYTRMGESIGIDLTAHPEQLTLPEYAVQSACCWWQNKGLNNLCDNADPERFKLITRMINGGINGLADREALWNRAKNVLIQNIQP